MLSDFEQPPLSAARDACRIGYPIVWGFCEGSDYATVSTEAILYGILDFFAKVVFGWIVMINLDLLGQGSKGGR